jgi:HEAT repeat protein/flagellar basal body rod protein FlgF
MLTCQTGSQTGENAVLTRRELGGPEQRGLSEVSRLPEDWARRTLSDTKRVDREVARLAVSTVAGSQGRPLLRVDTTVLGTGVWPEALLANCGLQVRRHDTYLLVETDQPGGLGRALRQVLKPIHEAIDRSRGNLLTQQTVGQRARWGYLERLIGPGEAGGWPGGRNDVLIDFGQGPVTETGHALDLAIQGKGLFVVEVKQGERERKLYTRDGRLRLGGDGSLMFYGLAGAKLSPEVALPPDSTQVAITPNGGVSARANAGQLLVQRGRIALAWFEHPERLSLEGAGFYGRSTEAGALIEGYPTEGLFGSLQQGGVEGSNVDVLDAWCRLCRLEDARQLVLGMIAELEHGEVEGRSVALLAGDEVPSADGELGLAGERPRWAGMAKRQTIVVEMPEVGADRVRGGLGVQGECGGQGRHEGQVALLKFVRARGTDVWVGDGFVEFRRDPETAATLVEYLKFLRKRLDVLGENIANANPSSREADGGGAYRRRVVQLRDDGQVEVIEDASLPQVVWEVGDGRGTGDQADGPRLVRRSNVDLEGEMAEADTVSREYRAIRQALEDVGREAVPALCAMLEAGPPEMRIDAAWALGQIGDEARAAVPLLTGMLQSEDWELRRAASTALQRTAPDSAVVTQAMVEAWTAALGGDDPRHRYEAAAALGRMGGKAAAAVPRLMERLDDPTSGAARALGQIGPAAAGAVAALAKALQHQEPYVREQAADALGRIGPQARAAVPALLEAMKDADWEVRWRAATAIGLIGAKDSGCLAVLTGLLEDENSYVRQRVAETLGQLGVGSTKIERLLQQAGRAEELGERVWPLFALGLIGEKPASSVLSLTAILLRDERSVRLAACEALARLGPLAKPAVPVLAELAGGRDGAVAAAAIDALAAMGPAAADAVGRLSLALEDDNPFIRRRAAKALGCIGTASATALPALTARLSDDSEQVAAACAEAIGRLGPPAAEAAEALRRLARHRNGAVKSAVEVALRRIEADAQDAGARGGEGAPVPAMAEAGDELEGP